MFKLLLLTAVTELFSSVNGQTACQERGWFGDSCRYKCRCVDPAGCDLATGRCSGSAGCLPGWFGPSCQHADLAHGQPISILNGTGFQRNISDHGDSTCAVASFLEVALTRKYLVSWVRLISTNTSAWSQVRVYLVDTTSNNTQECTGQGSAVVQWEAGGVVDVHCREAVFVDTVQLSSDDDTAIVCSLHVDGGRNVAIRGTTSQIGTSFPHTADRSVDGNTDHSATSGSCSRTSDNAISFGCDLIDMATDPWWQVLLSFQVKVTRFVVYARQGNEQRLTGVRLFVSDGDPSYSPVYQHPPDAAIPDALLVSLKTPLKLDRVALQVPGRCRILDMCEVEVYGERLCPDGRHGVECQGECRCRDVTELCQPTTGGCRSGCPDGYTGLACDQKCSPTQYGKDCSEDCSRGCREGKCDHVTGQCTLGCDDGWFEEPKCERACDPGFWGPNCSKQCPAHCKGGTCNSIGYCEGCMPGYEGFKCEQECQAGKFGEDCQEACSYHCEVLACHHVTGACACRAGWKLDLCIDPCDVTTWGRNCTNACSSGCIQRDCDAVTGVCQHGCGNGFQGDFCDEPCPPGTFGKDCGQRCSSQCADSLCNHVNGHCINCPQGFKDDFCQTPCEAGTWGSRCTGLCSANCNGPDKACSPTDGTCTAGCGDGYRGLRCTQECRSGTFGTNCSLSCSDNCLSPGAGNSLCHHVTGNCPQGCNEGYSGTACLTQMTSSAALVGGVVAAVIIFIVVLLVIAVIIYRRRWKNPKHLSPQTGEENGNVRPLSAAYVNTSQTYVNTNRAYVSDGKGSRRPSEGGFDDEDEASDVGISMATGSDGELEKRVYYNTCAELSSTRMASRDLASALERWRSDPAPLVEQFENLPKGLISTTSVALNVANKSKNRYKNICAYDHSRVSLKIIDGDPNSDYINACTVNGYDGQPKFIASQGPNTAILDDFLRMLWEKSVTTVVMLTNTFEAGKHKCEQYWPDSGEKKYGTVTVTMLSTRRTADYVIRTLQLAKEGRKIQVTQHHFTSWPDKGVPLSPWPLVDFHMVVSAHVAAQPHEAPIVVHCSAGIGRTGTYIALDNLLCEAAATLALDFNTCVWKLRQARVNMIQTVEQYIFLHEAVLVGLAVAGSLTSKEKLPDLVTEMSKPTAEGFSRMASEFKRLGTCQCKQDEDDYGSGRQDDNITKNRYFNILPRDSCRPILTTSVTGTNDYINAVFLPGYRKQSHFVVTQMPLASTVLDLWRLVGEFPVSTVVVFPSMPTTVGDTAPEFLPEEGQTCQFGPYKVTGRSYTSHEGYEEGFIYMVKSKRLSLGRNGRGLHVLKCAESAPGPDLMLSMAQGAIFGVPDKQLDESLILVVCRTGAEMSGVFVAVAQLIQRLGEASISVPTVVGHLRTFRPQLVSSLEQYQTIYEAVKLFAINSSVYTNMEMAPPQKPLRKGTKDRRRNSSGHRHSRGEHRQSKEVKGERKDKDNGRLSNNANRRANGSVSNANGSANSANSSANSANGSATNASGSPNNAKDSASSANGSANDGNGAVATQASAEDGDAENRAGVLASGGDGGAIVINGKGHVNFSL